jgi:restriction endonuclease S subunit
VRYKAYPEYKESGYDSFGQVPKHWIVCKLKHIKSEAPNAFVDGPFGSNLKSEHFVDNGDVYVIESNFATTGKLDTTNLKTISNSHFNMICRSETKEGAIIIAKIGARYGMSSILPAIDKKAVVSGNSLSLQIDTLKMDLFFCHKTLIHQKVEDAMDDGVNITAQPALSLGQLNNLHFVNPPLPEQTQIAKFLDYETARIDTLIEKQQRLIELLKEKRQAVISHAVTKGLNPDAPMKDSGVEWLGEVPAHWEWCRIGNVASIKHGYAYDSSFFSTDSGPYILTTPGNFFETGGFRDRGDRTNYFVGETQAEFILKPFDLIIAMTEQAAGLLGSAAFIPDDGQLYLHNQRLGKLNTSEVKISKHYLFWAFNSPYLRRRIAETSTGIKVKHTSPKKVLSIHFAVPPLSEQTTIAIFLDNETTKFNIMIEKTELVIALLKERRTALISAAVTGKIDVRDWEASNE